MINKSGKIPSLLDDASLAMMYNEPQDVMVITSQRQILL